MPSGEEHGDSSPLEGQHEGPAPAEPGAGSAERQLGLLRELAAAAAEARSDAHESEARFREVAQFAPVILWMKDADGQAIYVNARWAELTGPSDRSVREAWIAALHPEDAPRVREEVDGSVRRREPFRCEYRVRSRDGGWRWVIDMGRPRTGPDGRVLGYVGSVVDITDRHRAEEALREADRQKSRFLAVLSHELRNPLAPIRNSLFLLDRAEPGSAIARRAREILKRQTEHLNRLVDDLLDITRINSGKVELQRVRLDAREVVRRACNDVRDVFEQRGVDLAFREEPEPLWVEADGARLAQIAGNLLNNALKFTRPGGRVQVAAEREGSECQIRVRDTGVGIGAEDLDRIFDPFVQAPRSRQHAQGGMGIGLALVRELAVRQGGSVRVASGGPDQGAEFVVSLPLVEAPPAPASLDAGVERGSRALSILIVEDNVDAGATLADLLSLGGNSVRTVSSGRAGVEATLGEPPDVLICDIGLPDLSGHEVIRAVRASPAGRDVFAIALTGYAQPHDREEALAAGFDAHLPKPPAIADLERLLLRAALSGRCSGTSA